MSSTLGSATSTGWNRRSSAGSFSMCSSVLVERRRADRAELAAREHRLQQVPGVHRALGRARADDRVQLVDERDDLPVAVGDLLEHRLEALLELAAVLRPGEHRAEVERDDDLPCRLSGTSPSTIALRQPLDDRGLADAGLADQHRVVLRPAAEHLDRAADLLVAADHRVELALARGMSVRSRPYFSSERKVSSGFSLVTRRRPRTSASAASAASRVTPAACEQPPGAAAVLAEHREQQVLGGDVLVGELLGLGGGGREHARGLRREPDLRLAPREDLGQRSSASSTRSRSCAGVTPR